MEIPSHTPLIFKTTKLYLYKIQDVILVCQVGMSIADVSDQMDL
jgi:hypothetical protein